MTELSPRILLFPEKRRKADCQRERSFEVVRTTGANLLEHLQLTAKGLDDGLTAAEVRDEYEARRCEEILQYWATKLAENRRRDAAYVATVLNAMAGRLIGEVQS